MASSRAKLRSTRVLPADPGRSAGPIERLVLDGRRLDMQIGDRLLGARLERTVDGPNTLTLVVWDRDAAVLGSGVLGERLMSNEARIALDGLAYVVAGTSRDDGILTLTAEDDVFTILKRHGVGKPVSTSRDSAHTRASFCAGMIRDAGVPVIVLDEHVVQPIKDAAALKTELAKARGDARKSGRSQHSGVKGDDLKIKTAAATTEQRRNVAKALEVAADVDAPEVAILAMLCAGIGESAFKAVPNEGGSNYHGVFQGSKDVFSINDTAGMARSFLLGGKGFQGGGAIKLASEGKTPGEIATIVEGSGEDPSFYGEWLEQAKTWLNAGVSGTISAGSAWERDFAFDRRKKESTYAACRRLLDEVKWRLFAREGVVIIASDTALMRARPSLALVEFSDAIPNPIDFDWHRALAVGEATGQFYVRRYQADPGETVQVNALPPLQRKWLMATTSVSLFEGDLLGDFTLRKPQKPLDEPPNEVASDSAASGESGTAERYYAECKRISDAGGSYVYGGGHGISLSRLGSGDGMDCSSSISLALYRAGLFGDRTVAITSGEFAASFGKPGRGKHITIWANGGHVWSELHGLGKFVRFDTGGPGGGKGPRTQTTERVDQANFTPRHIPGL